MSEFNPDTHHTPNGWESAQKHPRFQQLITSDGRLSVRISRNRRFIKYTTQNADAPAEMRWEVVLTVRTDPRQKFTGFGPTNDAAYWDAHRQVVEEVA